MVYNDDLAAIIFGKHYSLPKTGLFIQATGQSADEIFPESETEFFMDLTNGQISFVKDDHDVVTQLIGHQDGQEFVAKKVLC